MTPGEQIRAARKSAGMSADELADVIGVAANTVYRWERGELEVSVQRMREVADATGAHLDIQMRARNITDLDMTMSARRSLREHIRWWNMGPSAEGEHPRGAVVDPASWIARYDALCDRVDYCEGLCAGPTPHTYPELLRPPSGWVQRHRDSP